VPHLAIYLCVGCYALGSLVIRIRVLGISRALKKWTSNMSSLEEHALLGLSKIKRTSDAAQGAVPETIGSEP